LRLDRDVAATERDALRAEVERLQKRISAGHAVFELSERKRLDQLNEVGALTSKLAEVRAVLEASRANVRTSEAYIAKIEARLTELAEENEMLAAGYTRDPRGGWAKPAPFVGYEATVTALRAALERWGQHESKCNHLAGSRSQDWPCTCGLDAALAGGKP
jgi:DNA repair exonuclease SbcCD ATPase subunit